MKRILLIQVLILLLWGCYYENEESLYGKPSSVCDTVNVTYSKSVQPIIQTWCLACHSNRQADQGAGGGNHLEGYSNLKVFAANGWLLGAVEHLPGFSPMPKYSNKLDSCDIAKIRIWVNQGAPNN